MEELTITRALTEVKMLEKRVKSILEPSPFLAIVVGKAVVGGYPSNEEFEKVVKGKHQSVMDLIKRRESIKAAIIRSNAIVKVTIGGIEMTVAEAIEKKSSIQIKKNLRDMYRMALLNAIKQVETHNNRVRVDRDKLVAPLLSKDGSTSADSSEYGKTYMAENEAKLLDPIKMREVIDKLDDEINQFEMEVDFILSESNSITTISI